MGLKFPNVVNNMQIIIIKVGYFLMMDFHSLLRIMTLYL